MANKGRPCGYTVRMGAKICDQLAQGKSLTEICDQPGYPDRGTVRRWVAAQPDFRTSYESSRLAWADELFEQIVTIANQARQIAEAADARDGNSNAAIAALREEIRAKMWVCARLRPDKYGDRAAVELSGRDGEPLIPEADPRRLALALHSILAASRPQQPLPELTMPRAGAVLMGRLVEPAVVDGPASPAGSLVAAFGADAQAEPPDPLPWVGAVADEQRAANRAVREFDTVSGQIVKLRGR
jgi:hypothetical protein